jgi:hypothetical protein
MPRGPVTATVRPMPRLPRPLTAIVSLATVLTLGCTAATPGETTRPASAPAASAPTFGSASATFSAPSPSTATSDVLHAEAGGLVLTATLDRSRVAAGEEVVITGTLRNPTDQPISVAGCGKPSATVFVPLPQAPAGKDWPGIAGRFKRYVLKEANGPGIVPALEPLMVTLPGDWCANDVLETALAPGQAITSSSTWTARIVDGVDALSGPVRFRVAAGYGLLNPRPSRDPNETGPGISWSPIYHEIALEGTIEVEAGGQTLAGPGEVVDGLLADPTFARWLAARPAKTWSNANLFLTSQAEAVGILPAGPSWEVDLFREVGVPRHWAIGFVDPFDATVRSVTYCDIPCDR